MSADSKAKNFDKALISGHYIFSTDSFIQLKNEACNEANISIENLDHILYQSVRENIERFMYAFQIIGAGL